MTKIFILLFLLITGCSSTNNFEYSNLHSNNNKIFSLLSQIKVEGDNLYYKNQIYDINNIDGINFINLYKCFNLPDQKTNSNRIGNTVKVSLGFDIGVNVGAELVNDNIYTDLFNRPLECNKIKYNSLSYFDSYFSENNLFIILPIENNKFSLNQIQTKQGFKMTENNKNYFISSSIYFIKFFNFLQPTYHLNDLKEDKNLFSLSFSNNFDSPDIIQSSNDTISKIQISKLLRQYAIFSASLYILKKEKENFSTIDNYINFIKFLNNNLIKQGNVNNSLSFDSEVICVSFNLCINFYTRNMNNNFFNKLLSVNERNQGFSKKLLSIKDFHNINKNNYNDTILVVN